MQSRMTSAISTLKSFHTIKFRLSSIYSYTCHGLCGENASKRGLRFLQTPSLTAFDKENSREWSSPKIPQKIQMNLVSSCYTPGMMAYSPHQHTQTLRNLFPVHASQFFAHRAFSSPTGNNHDTSQFTTESSKGELPIQGTDTLNRVYESLLDAASKTGNMAKEATIEAGTYIEKLFQSYPYLKDIVVPVGWTLSSTVLVWIVLPRVLRRFHHYVNQTPFALLSGKLSLDSIPYEKSLWGSLEDPARYAVTFIAFSQLGVFIAPTTSQYLSQAWRGAIVLSVVWFLHRWKTNVLSLLLSKKISSGPDRDRIVALDKLSSIGLIILGMMALAEACGVAVQSIITVGGIGGVATAFAARDILGNLLSGLSIQFSQPFSIGDRIKAGSIEGRVVEMGLTTTSLISQENFPIIVPNSLFSSQVIVNKTRAQFRTLLKTIPFSVDDVEKIPNISAKVKSMLLVHPDVISEREAPYCFLSQIEDAYAELTLGCTLKNKGKVELYATEQDILLQVAEIIKQEGARLGSTLNLNR